MSTVDPHDMSRPSWKLYNRLMLAGVSVDEATELMNGYAHELAEQQRREADDLHQTEPGVVKGLRIGADLIDPIGAGPVRPDEETT